jgi:hypothetical protein
MVNWNCAYIGTKRPKRWSHGMHQAPKTWLILNPRCSHTTPNTNIDVTTATVIIQCVPIENTTECNESKAGERPRERDGETICSEAEEGVMLPDPLLSL